MESRRRVVVVGAVRDQAETLQRAVSVIGSALSGFDSVSWHLVESDSSDDTIAVLERLRASVPNFHYRSYGVLRERLARRTERIAFARNACVEAFLGEAAFAHAQYMAVADFDRINFGLTRAAVESSFDRDDWAGVFANQSQRYYDVWALRHRHWSPDDCWQRVHALVEEGIPRETASGLHVAARQIHLPEDAPWIEVESAFGGFGIYRRESLQAAHYTGLAANGVDETCEHIAFHEGIRSVGGRLFINPRMINAGWTEHTRAHQPWRVPFRAVKWSVAKFVHRTSSQP